MLREKTGGVAFVADDAILHFDDAIREAFERRVVVRHQRHGDPLFAHQLQRFVHLPRRFTVQRHDARALHFDLRLEVDGALASWAVPKGPPLREGVKRLAVRTEDHPLEYLEFAAVIPAGQYGAGRMTVWDMGTWTEELRTADEWKLVLEGRILRGHYHLVRTGRRGGKDEWLIFRSGSGPPGPTRSTAARRRPHGRLRAVGAPGPVRPPPDAPLPG